MSMRTSDAVAISIVICAARSHAGSAMAITTGEGRSGNGCPSMNGRRMVEARSRIGDWEADTVIGKLGGAVLVTLVERRSRLSLIALAPNKTAEAVKAAILKVLQPLSAQVHTLTYPIFVTLSHTPLCINGLFFKKSPEWHYKAIIL